MFAPKLTNLYFERCPNCGSKTLEVQTSGLRDHNRAICKCGWVGVETQLLPGNTPVPTLAEFILGTHMRINIACTRRVSFELVQSMVPEELVLSYANPVACKLYFADPDHPHHTTIPESTGHISYAHAFKGYGRTPEEAFAVAWIHAVRELPNPNMAMTSSLLKDWA